MFMCIYDWMEDDGSCFDTDVRWFDTKEELLEHYAGAKIYFADLIKDGRLIISAGINYSWADIERLF